LVHGDLRADNMIATASGVILVDWAHATVGAPWPDFADLGVQLVISRSDPAAVEAALSSVQAWRQAPAEAATSYLIALAGYWTRSSRQAAPPSVPALRPYQGRAAVAALRWVRWRTAR
jgi:aminoglycoside phosphotransferase (APT) family kinase protein